MNQVIDTVGIELKQLEQEYAKLARYFTQFMSLKEKVSAEMAESQGDPRANEKLAPLYEMFPGGFAELERNYSQEMKTLTVALKKIEAQLKHALVNHE